MNCVFEALVSCILSTLTISADARWQVSSEPFYWMDGKPYHGAIGDARVSFDIPVTRTMRLTITPYGHTSYVDTNRDRGFEYSGLGLTWTPFARERGL